MVIADTSTPVVLLEAINHGSLGIARSLGRLGVRVLVVERNRMPAASLSRYCRRCFRADVDFSQPHAVSEFLVDKARAVGRRCILIATTDESALFVADNAPLLREWFTFPDQRAETAHALASKLQMFGVATKFGIPTPAIMVPDSRRDVLDFAERAAFPVVMKLIHSRRKVRPGIRSTSIAHSPGELLERYDQAELDSTGFQQPQVMLQEYIPGGEDTIWMFNGYFDDRSRCLFGMTGRKLRQSPAYTGAACLAVCEKNKTVYDTTIGFMQSIGYRGILDIGYRYDVRDGKYKVLDVNPRIGSTFRLFVDSGGMDVARAMYLDLTGQRVLRSAVSDGRRWMVEDCDVVSSIRYWLDGKLTFRQWTRSLVGIEETAFFSIRDPLPMLAVAVADARNLLVRGCETVQRRTASSPGQGNASRLENTTELTHRVAEPISRAR